MPLFRRFVGFFDPQHLRYHQLLSYHLPRKLRSIRSSRISRATSKHPERSILHQAKSQSSLPLPHMESCASLHYAFVLMGYASAYPLPSQVEYGYPYSPPPSPKVYSSPPSPSYQGYFNDEYPPSPPSQPNCHNREDGYCLSFLKGCLAAVCCCCIVEEYYF